MWTDGDRRTQNNRDTHDIICKTNPHMPKRKVSFLCSDVSITFAELQIREGIGDNSKVYFLISKRKHM